MLVEFAKLAGRRVHIGLDLKLRASALELGPAP